MIDHPHSPVQLRWCLFYCSWVVFKWCSVEIQALQGFLQGLFLILFSSIFLTILRIKHMQMQYILNLNTLTILDVLMSTLRLTHFLKSRA